MLTYNQIFLVIVACVIAFIVGIELANLLMRGVLL